MDNWDRAVSADLVCLRLSILGVRARSYFGCWGLFFACQVPASEDHLAPAVKDSLVFLCMPLRGLRGPAGPSCQELSGLIVCQFWAWKDHLVPTARNDWSSFISHNLDSQTALKNLQRFLKSLKIIGGLIRPFKILRGLIMPFKFLKGPFESRQDSWGPYKPFHDSLGTDNALKDSQGLHKSLQDLQGPRKAFNDA